MDNILRNWHSY